MLTRTLPDGRSGAKAATARKTHSVYFRVSKHRLFINPANFQFGRPSITSLGYHVTAVPIADRVDAVIGFPSPHTMKAL